MDSTIIHGLWMKQIKHEPVCILSTVELIIIIANDNYNQTTIHFISFYHNDRTQSTSCMLTYLHTHTLTPMPNQYTLNQLHSHLLQKCESTICKNANGETQCKKYTCNQTNTNCENKIRIDLACGV